MLPNAAGPHYSVCFSLPLSTELDTSPFDANTSSWSSFLPYAERRALLRHPLTARAVILGDNPGAEPASDVITASVPLAGLREWPCLRPAGLAVRKHDLPLMVRPGSLAKSLSPVGLTRHRDLVYTTLASPSIHDHADVLVLFWPLQLPLYELPPLPLTPPALDDHLSKRLDWADKVRTTMHELGMVMVLLWDTAASTEGFCLDAAAEAISDHPDTDAILGLSAGLG